MSKMLLWSISVSGLLASLGCATAHGYGAGSVDLGGPPMAEGAKITKVSGDYVFTEGCSSDADGNVYFTDQKIAKEDVPEIWKWSADDGKVSLFLKGDTGRANGTVVDHQGRLITCSDENFAMWAFDVKTKQHEVLFNSYKGKTLNSCNDVWVRPDGGMYFTDPYYKRSWWTRPAMEQDKQAVYFVPAGGHEPVRVIDDYQQPNGIVGTPDGKTLYVADIRARQTYAYDIQPDGSLANKRLFAESGSDGMTIDNRGDVYMCSGGVKIFDPSGKLIQTIPSPDRQQPANICFGGKDMHTLFMTARTGFYSVPMNAYGVGSQ